jgi:VWFA-related protein
VLGGFFLSAQQPPPKPSFQSSVEVTSLDVTVVDDRGKPITNLAPADFAVRIDGNPRRVVTAEWVPLITEVSAAAPAPPDGYSTNESATGGRLIVIAVDQPNIRFGGAIAITKAANGFIDRLLPSDRVAVAGIGVGAPSTVFTSDHTKVKQTIARMVGQKMQEMRTAHSVALVEAIAIERGDPGVLENVISRECAGVGSQEAQACRFEVESEAREKGRSANQEGNESVQALTALFIGLRAIDAPKTLILISEGFIANENTSRIMDLGTMAASARTSLYALKLDTQLFDVTNARAPINAFADRQAQAEGLEMLAASSRGALFTVTGTAESLFERISSELSPDSRRRAAQGRRRSIAAPAGERGKRSAGATNRSSRRQRRARVAAPRHGDAVAGGVVRAAGTGARQGAAPAPRRHRHRLPIVEGRVGQLRDHQRRGAGRGHQIR